MLYTVGKAYLSENNIFYGSLNVIFDSYGSSTSRQSFFHY